MSKKILCPYCYEEFSNTDVEYQCQNPKCTKEPDVRYNEFWKRNRNVSHFFKGKAFNLFGGGPKASKCDKCHSESTRFVCPHCHNWLPTDMLSESSEIISILGAPASGKTVYFFTLMQELIRKNPMGITVYPQDVGPSNTKRTSVIFSEMVGKMYGQREVPDKTPFSEEDSVAFPLIFKLSNKGGANKEGGTIFIVFYDTAGEAFQSNEVLTTVAKHVKRSVGTIYLADPYDIAGLQQYLDPDGKMAEERAEILRKMRAEAEDGKDLVEINNDTVITALVQNISDKEREKDLKGHSFAFVISKIDDVLRAMEEAGDNTLGGCLRLGIDSSYIRTRNYNAEELDTISTYLERLGGNFEIANDMNRVKQIYGEDHVHFFGVSALGGKPVNGMIKDGVRPFRVMDPLIWILHQMGGFGF